ncbi:LacI family DNA-binding transcriptional regulator [uncultured Robinsoniella sp.]|uniref:LacI family DNA-binding transcriptional regulator n=1 Tax=uncultured Robinsoniella sp. TaxID=904190 RepID=UPI00374EA743
MNIKLIAETAGVSLATVSRVLNGKENVNQNTRERVLEVIRELGYDKIMFKKSNSIIKNNIITVVLHDIHKPFYHDLLYYFQKYAQCLSYEVMFYSTLGEDCNLSDQIEMMTRISAGIILFSSYVNEFNLIRKLQENKYPIVVIDNSFPGIEVNTLMINNRKGSQLAVEYLLGLGHVKIACLAGSPNLMVWADRVNGYIETMRMHNIFIHKDYIQYADNDIDGVKEAVHALLDLDSGVRPSAICCFDDAAAFEAIEVIQSEGLKVPLDISIIGFDCQHVKPNFYMGPKLTSIRQPFELLAKHSLELIEGIISGKFTDVQVHELYDTELYVGGTTARFISNPSEK